MTLLKLGRLSESYGVECATLVIVDGLLRCAERLRIKSILKGFDSQSNQYSVEGVTFYVRSTVLGGAIICELNELGGKDRGFVYLGEQVLAVQSVSGSSQVVTWQHYDASGGSYRATDSSGQVFGSAEMDPVGADAGLVKSNPWLSPRGSGQLEPYFSVGDLNSTTQCNIDGMPAPCVIASNIIRAEAVQSVTSVGFSMRRQVAVWVARDTSTATARQTGEGEWEVNIVDSGPGGEFVWVDDVADNLQTFVQGKTLLNPQNPSTIKVPLDAKRLEGLMIDTLKYGDCAEYVTRLINMAAGQTGKPFESTDIMALFERIKSQPKGGILFDRNDIPGHPEIPPVAGGGGWAWGWYPQGNAMINIYTLSYYSDNPRGAARTPYAYGERGLHEVIHLSAKGGLGYNEAELTKAARALEPNGTFGDWDGALKNHCLPSQFR